MEINPRWRDFNPLMAIGNNSCQFLGQQMLKEPLGINGLTRFRSVFLPVHNGEYGKGLYVPITNLFDLLISFNIFRFFPINHLV